MLDKKKRVISLILIACMILSSKNAFVFADTINMSYVKLVKNDIYVEDEIEKHLSESDVKNISGNERVNYSFMHKNSLKRNLLLFEKKVNYGFMQITNPKVFENEIFAIKFSVSIKGDIKHKSIDKIIEDADIQFEFDNTKLEYVASYVISTASEYPNVIKKIGKNKSIGIDNNGILKIENLSAKVGKRNSISLVLLFKAIKYGDTKVVIKNVLINNKDYIAPYMKRNYALVNINKYEGNDKNKFDAWYKDEFGNWYYYVNDRTEKMKGWFKDYRDQQKYYFDEDTGIMVVGAHIIDDRGYFFNNVRDYWDNWYEIGDGFYECYGNEGKTYGALLYG